jgi:uncharacterized membrane protein YdcZ (DUF606 family)
VAIWSYLVFAFLGGAMFPTQLGINPQIAGRLGGSVLAAMAHVASALSGGAPGSRNQVP